MSDLHPDTQKQIVTPMTPEEQFRRLNFMMPHQEVPQKSTKEIEERVAQQTHELVQPVLKKKP